MQKVQIYREKECFTYREENLFFMEGIRGCQIILVHSKFGIYVQSLITPLDSSCSAIEWLLNFEKIMR